MVICPDPNEADGGTKDRLNFQGDKKPMGQAPGPTFYGHGQFSTKTYNDILSTCTVAALQYPGEQGLSPECNALLDRMEEEIGGYYDYGLYDDCTYQNGLLLEPLMAHRSWRNQHSSNKDRKVFQGALNDYACGGGEAMESWVNITSVRDALHVSRDSFFFSGDKG